MIKFWRLYARYCGCCLSRVLERMADAHAADVQAELQAYLNTKNINSLFINIVESLLIEKPANPIAFIVEYLYKQYPDKAQVALDSITGGASAAPAAE